jgi:hypothetical protein
MSATYAHTTTYARTHSVTFLSDNLLNTLREIIRENGLSPEKLMQDRDVIASGLRTWLASGDLTRIVVEFYRPGGTVADARWELPVTYDGSGVDDDMWVDKNYLRQLIAKAKRPATDCSYRIILFTSVGAQTVAGFSDCSLLPTGSLVARSAGTVIATGHMTAAITYWK